MDELSRALDEFLSAREDGAEVNLEDLEQRVGEDVEEFRGLVRLVGNLERLAALAEDEESCDQDGEVIAERYRVTGLLGEGGNSTVYRVYDSRLKRDIALKVIGQEGTGVFDAETSLAEARALARIEHPSVVRVFDADEHDGRAYIAMERIQGPSLRDVLRAMKSAEAGAENGHPEATLAAAHGLRSIAARCRFVARLASALAYCHEADVLHRDIKPENILVTAGLVPKLIDFGLAHHESAGSVWDDGTLRGTPPYLAPEQVDRERTGSETFSDQFSLGVVFYELLALENPFARASQKATLEAISTSAPPSPRKKNPDLPPDVELVCLHCLERLPSQRYAGVAELADDLERFLDHRAISLRPPSGVRRGVLWLRRNKKQVTSAALTALCVGVLLALVWGAVSLFLAKRESAEFLSDLSIRKEGLNEITEPEEFEELLMRINGACDEAQGHDRSLLGKWFGLGAVAAVQDLYTACVERLDEVTARVNSESRSIRPSQRIEPFKAFYNDWDDARYLARTSPAATDARGGEIHWGAVDLPEGGTLEQYSPFSRPHLPEWNLLENWAGTSLLGFYRYTLQKDEHWLETEFQVRPLEPLWSPQLQQLSARVKASLLTIPSGNLGVEDSSGSFSVPHEGFEISAGTVTWRDFLAVFDSDELVGTPYGSADAQPSYVDLGHDAPAILPWVFAQEYAVRVGARLPTVVELSVALASEGIDLAEGLKGEWTSAYFANDDRQRFWLRYPAPAVDPETPIYLEKQLSTDHDESLVLGVAFRVATSVFE